MVFAANQNIVEREFWLKKLSGCPSKVGFPYDFKKNGDRYTKKTVEFQFNGDIYSRLQTVSNNSDVRMHIILVGCLVALLNKYSGSKDIIIGTPVYKAAVEGEFINTILALRNRLEENTSFKELLLQVRETVAEADEHQDYPIEILTEQLNLPVSEDGFPLFDTAVLLENIQSRDYLRHIHINMIFSFLRTGECIRGVISYNPLLYREDTIGRIASHLTAFAENVLYNLDVPLPRIDILSGEEKRQLIVGFNETKWEPPAKETIHRWFEEQTAETPAAIAVVYRDEQITYRELNRRANQLAHLLRKRGVTAGAIVALMMTPSIEMIAAVIGILKAGGAYLPIDPDYPRERILSMLKDSRACLLLSKEMLIADFRYISLQDFETGFTTPVVTPRRAQVEELDGLQIPDRSLIDYEKYGPYIGQAMVKNSITIHMSRGCVYNCAFCFKIWPRKYIIRSAENIFDEIHFYYKLGIRRFAFVDDLPNINIDISTKVFRLIIENNLNVHLHFPNGIRGDILTKEYIDLMVKAGTVTMDLALETTSPRLQKLVRKNLNLKRLEENIKYITREHPQVILELQILHGIPTETEEEAAASLDFIKNIKWVHFPYIHILNIYPGSDMAGIAMEHGISREAIKNSADIAYHELPETLPFSKEFTRKYQAEFLNEYFLSKERLLSVLPYQLNVLTEDELVQKYNSYLPMEIRRFSELLELAGISPEELNVEFLPEDYGTVPGLNRRLRSRFPQNRPQKNALNILLLDLSQYFTGDNKIMYDVVEPPLGLLYLLTHLEKTFGCKINGKIAKSRIDFDGFDELNVLIRDFKPDVIGIRTLNFYKDFFHKTVSLLRQWGTDVPIIAGGPYATGNYSTLLQDKNIDLAVLGEGEITLADVIEKILENNGKLPNEKILKTIPGIAFIQNKEKAVQREFNREILLFDRLEGRLSDLSRKNPGIPGKPTDLSYIIYTSGSTGNPKGVMIQHNNLVNQIAGLIDTFDLDASFKYLLLASFTFDVSVMHIFTPLLTGARLYVIGDELKKDSQRLWQFIHENKIDILNIVPAFMKAILKDIEKKKIHFRYLFVGGDVFDNELYTALRETFTVGEIINIYGPTETTINAVLHRCRHRETGESLPIGKPLTNYRVSILDKASNLVPIGVKGELFISGAGVSRGYLNRPDLTAERFSRGAAPSNFSRGTAPSNFSRGTAPHKSYKSYKTHIFYKTGDLARWLPDGNIEFLGRIDHQVKIRGFRIELGEIESRLVEYPGIKEALVVCREDQAGDKYLSAYTVSDDDIPESVLKRHLLKYLPHYMIPPYFSRLEKIPLTPGGKIDRKLLPALEIKTGKDFVPPRNGVEEKLAEVWAGVLSLEKEQISIDGNFFRMGGHSLKATILLSRIHSTFNVNVTLRNIFKTPTIRGLAAYIESTEKDQYISIAPAEKKEYYSLSSAQKRLFLLNRMKMDGTGYNMPSISILEGEIQKDVLEICFNKLLRRHESFRTSFHLVDEKPVQKVHEHVEFGIEYSDLAAKTRDDTRIKEFIRPFDLSRAPLLRVGLIKEEDTKHLLLVDMHHIISDGVSSPLLVKDFIDFYAGKDLPEPSVKYKDFSEWQNREKERERIKQQEAFWVNEFEGEIPVLELPADFPRPAVQGFEGNRLYFDLTPELTGRLEALALETGTTTYMVILALYSVLLSKLGGREDIVIGSPTAGRGHADLEKVIGMFVNTLALRTYPSGEKTFTDFLSEVKEKVLTAFRNQDYQYEELVEQVAVNRNTSRNPLFDTMFVLQNVDIQEADIPGLKLSPYPYENETSKFDLTLIAVQAGDKLLFTFEYSTKLFRESTIERFIRYFKKIMSDVLYVGKKGILLSELEIISNEEKRRILFDFNDTETAYLTHKTLHRLFEEQVEKTPDRIAVSGSLLELSYRELNEKSGRLAFLLRRKGVGFDTIVGLMVERSIEMVVGILGILKSGGAYLPIEPYFPADRVAFMLGDCGAGIFLSGVGELSGLSGVSEVVDINSVINQPTVEVSYPDSPPGPSNLAYVIYTSGSTGRPKGVVVEHKAVVNLLFAMQAEYPLGEPDTFLLKTSYVFDVSAAELFGWYLDGGRVAVLEKGGEKDPRVILDDVAKYRVTHINFVPSLFNAFLVFIQGTDAEENRNRLSRLKYILLAGEAVRSELAEKARRLCPGVRVENIYGPTETTVYASRYSLSHWDGSGSVPIGKPLPNYNLYILSRYDFLQPVGIPGELLISGSGLARGYLNRPDLTAEKFSCGAASSLTTPYALPLNPFYRTGDLCRWLPDGNIEFLGRLDHQVKIRGFRIELGEIERQLLSLDEINTSAVIAMVEKGDSYLCAYFTSDKKIEIPELRDNLAKKLPNYMIPSYFNQIERMPITTSGKIDRKVLASMDHKIDIGKEFVEPQNEIEKKIAQIWKELLGLDKVGIHDNFFEIGGNSLKVITLNSKLSTLLQIDIPVTVLYQNVSIGAFLRYLTEKDNDSSDCGKVVDQSSTITEVRKSRERRMERRK